MNQIKKILCYGDSNTFGLRPDNSGRYNRFTRWTGILQNKLGPRYTIIEDGSCGRTTIHDDLTRPYKNGKDFLLPSITYHKPIDLIVMMLGTNDLKTVYHPTTEKIGYGIETLLDLIENNPASNDGSIPRILLISPIHLKDEVWKDGLDLAFDAESVRISKLLEEAYRKIAAKHKCHFFSASSVTEASNLDAEHLDEVGHLLLANALYPVICSIL